MLSGSTRQLQTRALTTLGSRFGSTASPWGTASWRYDKTEFLTFCKNASLDTPGPAKREWNGYLALSFADVDADKDGKISAAEFDTLCENVAKLPRRFGFAPTWEVEYGGDIALRTTTRQKMFDKIDGMNGPLRGWIGCAQFIQWATSHVASKVAGVKSMGVDFYHVSDYNKDDFLNAIDIALHNPASAEYTNFYEFLLTIFVEEDHQCKGVVNKEGFSRLVDRAAFVPRHFGLAPPSADAARVAELYAEMEDSRLGGVTFRKFLQWTTAHTKAKIEAYKSRFGSTASPWGTASWRYDKTEFLAFCKNASLDTPNPAKREWNGYLALSFADVDADKDGKINAAEFDTLCENVAKLPRRFGFAPTWEVEYGGDIALRTTTRQKMFDEIDGMNGSLRGWIGCAQFIQWATSHVASKVAGVKSMGVDFYHVSDYSKDDFLKAIDIAVHDPASAEKTNFYEFLLTIFVEEDHQCKGVVNKEGFSRLVDRAAFVPRHFGLAPPSADAARVAELYNEMEDKRLGGVTFRKFLQWTTAHTKVKIEAHKK